MRLGLRILVDFIFHGSWAFVGVNVFRCTLAIFVTLSCVPPIIPQTQPVIETDQPGISAGRPFSQDQTPAQQISGSITGTIVDQSGAIVPGALVTLTRDNLPDQEVVSDQDGQFRFANITPGAFQITVNAAGLTVQTFTGLLHSAEAYVIQPISLSVAAAFTNVRVEPPRAEIAEMQIKDQEEQRILGIIPNFYASYVPNAVALNSKQKFKLVWKTVIDPFTFAGAGITAGFQQATNTFPGYGQGAEGYAKRYGAAYSDIAVEAFIGNGVLPSLLKQDPRYFYKGTGSAGSRFLYAVANSVICKGDNGRWQPNYSNILGNLAAGGISNLYHPPNDRNEVSSVFRVSAMGIAETTVFDVMQEFLLRKLTSKHHQNKASP